MIRRTIPACLITIACLTVRSSLAQTTYEKTCAEIASQTGADSKRLHQLFDLDWEYSMHESPEFATAVGYAGQNDRWSDVSLDATHRRQRELQAPMRVLDSIDRGQLNAMDQLSYDLFRKNKSDAIESI